MSDAVSARVVEIVNDEPYCRIGRVESRGVVWQVNLSFVPEAHAGERVLVSNGVAVRVLGTEESNPEPV